MEKKDYERLKAYATVSGMLEDYVVLKEDEQGRYIEYAFKEGAPHDNRCLSWYDKLQPEALKRNGHDVDEWAKRLKKVGEVYRLHHMSCGHEYVEGEGHCSAGHPNTRCITEGCSRYWTYDEPVKCACWLLGDVCDIDKKTVPLGAVDKYISTVHGTTFQYGRQTMLKDICEWLSEHASEYAFPIYNGEELTDESYVCDGLVEDLKKAFEMK